MKKSLKHVYKELMNEQLGQLADESFVDNSQYYPDFEPTSSEDGLEDEQTGSADVRPPIEGDLILPDTVIAEGFFDLFCKAVEETIADQSNHCEKTIKIVESDNSTRSYTKRFTFSEMLDYIYFLVKVGELSTQDFTKIQINENNRAIEDLKDLLLQDTQDKKSNIVTKVIQSKNLNEFKANFFYFLYKKLYDQKAKLELNPDPDYKQLNLDVEGGFITLFDELLQNNQSAFTVNLGTLFEEIFKVHAYAIIASNGENTVTYSDILTNPNKYGIDINLKHKSKQISIVLIMACNKRFREGSKSAVYQALNSGSKPGISDYLNDLKLCVKMDKASDNRLRSDIDRILQIYAEVINIDKSAMLCDDYESDDIFCPLKDDNQGGYSNSDDEFMKRLKKYTGNAPFDFIVRPKEFPEGGGAIGLFDLKASNKGSKSSPLTIGSTGNNGGSENSALNFVKDIVRLGEDKGENFSLNFFGLIEIEYELDFASDETKDISIERVRHKIAPCAQSVRYSNDNDKFYLAQGDANNQTKIENESSLELKHYSGAFVNSYLSNKLSNTNDAALDFTSEKRQKIKGYEGLVVKLLNNLYGNHTSVLKAIESHDIAIYKPLYFNANYIQALVGILNKIKNDKEVKDLNDNVIKVIKDDRDPLMDKDKISYVAEGFLAYYAYLSGLSEEKAERLFNIDVRGVCDALKKYFNKQSSVARQRGERWRGVDSLQRQTTNSIVALWTDIYADQDVHINAENFCRELNRYVDELNKEKDDTEQLQDFDVYVRVPSQPKLHLSILDKDTLKDVDRVETIRNFIVKKIKNIVSDAPELKENSGEKALGDSYIRLGRTLTEVYSHLFDLKKTINEGALGGHMMHPYEALDMTPEQLSNRIKQYGVPQKIIEKVDGQNLFFTVETDGTLLFARNKEDMTHDDLVEKFTGHPAEKPFIEGGNAIKSGVESLLSSVSQEEVIRLFHPSEGIRTFVNFEIMHPEKPNQIIYDEKYIVFHGIVDYRNGREEVSRSNQDQRIQELVSLMSSGVSSAGFTLASNREVDLNQLTDIQIAEYTQKIYDISEALGMEEGETLGDGIMNVIGDEIEAEGVSLSDEALTIFTDYIVRGEDSEGRSIASREWTKLLSKEDVAKLRQLGLTSTAKVKTKIGQILQPFKALFVELGIDLLKGVQSSYMSADMNIENVELIRDKLSTAISDLENYISTVPEEEWSNSIKRLIPHMELINKKGLENIVSSAVEGGVYSANDNLFKVTGGFAPMNQIIGAAYRDNEGIFTTFKEKFMQQENNRRSLKDIFSLIF